jgi:hypothetical protein
VGRKGWRGQSVRNIATRSARVRERKCRTRWVLVVVTNYKAGTSDWTPASLGFGSISLTIRPHSVVVATGIVWGGLCRVHGTGMD